MKNSENWKPTKFVYSNGKLKASRNTAEVGVHSRLVADIVARFYDQNLQHHVKGRLIDLGCGKVPLFEAYKNLATDVTCADWGNSLHGNPYLDFEQDLNQPLKIQDAAFDTIILSDVLEHIRRPDFLVNEMFRILAPGGKLILNVPFYYWLHEQPFDFFRYTRYALEAMATDAGFTVVKLEASGGALEILADVVAKQLIKVPAVGKISARVIQKAAWLFINTKAGARYSAKSGEKFPLGYFMVAQKMAPAG